MALVVAIWAVELVNVAMGHRLCAYGIRPRTVRGLPGIALWAFLHAGVWHALVNTAPLLVLGLLVAMRGGRLVLRLSAFVVLVAGAGVWVFGRSSGGPHVGASGLTFGYFGFLVARAWYERSLASILTAAVTILLYGGMIWGVLPGGGPASWEGHLFGLLAGVFAAGRGAGFRRARGEWG